MIPSRNATDAHEQNFVVNDELLLHAQKAFAQCTRYYTLLEMFEVFNLFVVIQQSDVPTNNSPLFPLIVSSPHTQRQTRLLPPTPGYSRGLWTVYNVKW